MFPPQTPPNLLSLNELTAGRDFSRSHSTNSGPNTRNIQGKLPILNFPQFDGYNPRLWQYHCENYFDMYAVDQSLWVNIALMHFEGPTAHWLQYVDHRIHTANWSELCSWIHERFGQDQ
jgi:hypothetical protein